MLQVGLAGERQELLCLGDCIAMSRAPWKIGMLGGPTKAPIRAQIRSDDDRIFLIHIFPSCSRCRRTFSSKARRRSCGTLRFERGQVQMRSQLRFEYTLAFV